MGMPNSRTGDLSKIDSEDSAAGQDSTRHFDGCKSNNTSVSGALSNHTFFAGPRLSQQRSDPAFNIPSVVTQPPLFQESISAKCDANAQRFFQSGATFGTPSTLNQPILTRSESMPYPILPPVHTLSNRQMSIGGLLASRPGPSGERLAGCSTLLSSVPRQMFSVPKLVRSQSSLLLSAALSTGPGISPSTSPTSRQESPYPTASEVPGAIAPIRKAESLGGRSRRRYQVATPSKFCHICQKNNKATATATETVHIVCTNINEGFCRKSICKGCFVLYGFEKDLETARAVNSAAQFTCCHCQNKCPAR